MAYLTQQIYFNFLFHPMKPSFWYSRSVRCHVLLSWSLYSTGLMVRVFANGPGDLGSIPGRVIPKTQKMVLDVTLLKTQLYKVRIKVKWSNPGKGVAPSPTPRCSSYRKGTLLGHPQLRSPTLQLTSRGVVPVLYVWWELSHSFIAITPRFTQT